MVAGSGRSGPRRPGLASRATAGAFAGVVAALVTSLLVLGLASTGTTTKFLAGSGLVLMLASVAAVGLLVAWHRPGNPIGWLLLNSSVCFLLTFNAGSYATLIYHLHHRGLPFGSEILLLQPLGNAALIMFPLVIPLFPDGRLPSARWAWLLWPCLALVGAEVVSVVGVTTGAIAGHHVTVRQTGASRPSSTRRAAPPGSTARSWRPSPRSRRCGWARSATRSPAGGAPRGSAGSR
jgi:hypothetical protein